jgi:hypothetical protein
MRRRIAAVLATFAMTALALLAIASPAAAGEGEYATDVDWNDNPKYCWNQPNVSGCIEPNGDNIWVKDNVADGYAVVVIWDDLDGPRAGACYDTLGKAKGWTMCNKDWPEGHRIEWYLGWDGPNDTWAFTDGEQISIV